jgi:hypothetical protein
MAEGVNWQSAIRDSSWVWLIIFSQLPAARKTYLHRKGDGKTSFSFLPLTEGGEASNGKDG